MNRYDVAAVCLLVAIVIGALSGCSTSGGLNAQIAGANIEIAKQRAIVKPVLDAEIPTPNGIMKIVVHAPQTGPATVPMPDNGWARVAEKAVSVVGTAAGIYYGGEAAVSLVRGTSAGIVDALRTQPDPVIVTQPAPVIVPPADPVIVTQPEPVIVQQPAPVVVDPVVIQPQTQFGTVE